MFLKIKRKAKKFFSPLFDPQQKEKGVSLLVIGITMAVIAALTATGTLVGVLKFVGEEIGVPILAALATAVLWITSQLAQSSSIILQATMSSEFIGKAITKQPTVLRGWAIVRDFANMLIVLGFVIVGIATAIRYREYAAKRTLLPLIIVALLVNFSPLICGVVIDAANITVDYFLTAAGPGGITTPLLEGVNEGLKEKINDLDKENIAEFFAIAIGGSIFNTIALTVFFVLALLFLARYVALMILVILSPVAFFCYVFSFTKKYWNIWWSQFIQWCLVGVIASFFVFLAGHMLTGASFITGDQAQVTSLDFLVPCALLIIGTMIALSTSAMGASIATGAARRVGRGAKGAGKYTLKKTGGALRKTRAGKWAERKGGDVLEKMPVLGPQRGEMAQKREKRRNEAVKRMETEYARNPDSVIKKAKGRGHGMDNLAATMVAGKEGKLSEETLRRRGAELKAEGFDLEEIEKKMPHLAEKPKEVAQEMRTSGLVRQVQAEAWQSNKPEMREFFEEAVHHNPRALNYLSRHGKTKQRKAVHEWAENNYSQIYGDYQSLKIGTPEEQRKAESIRKAFGKVTRRDLDNNSMYLKSHKNFDEQFIF